MELEVTTNTTDVFLYPSGHPRNLENEARPSNPSSALGRLPSSTRTSPSSSVAHIVAQDNGESKETQDEPPSAILFVTVHLTIPPKVSPPKTLQSLVVSVKSVESLSFPRGRYEQGEPFNTSVTITQAAGTALQPGSVYRWEVAVPIPHTAPPYERARHGSVRQRVSAKAVFSGWINRTLTFDKPLAFVALPTKEPSESFSWSRTHAASTGHLGPLFVALRTEHLTVGGFLRIALVLSEPKPGLSLESFTARIAQQTRVRSRTDPKVVETSLPTYVEFFKATEADLVLKPHESAEKSWIARLPHCDQVRPTTIAGSDAAVNIVHNIQIHLSFYDKPFPSETSDPGELDAQGRRLYHYRINWLITLASCSLRWRTFRLPAYSVLDPDPVPETPREFSCDHAQGRKGCTCVDSLESLISYECEAESDMFTSGMLQEDIKRFRLLAARHDPGEQPISGGTGFVFENLEGHVVQETEEESKARMQREKELNEFAAIEDGAGEVRLLQGLTLNETEVNSSSK